MNLKTAIEIVQRYMNCDESDEPVEFDKAAKILIKAGKRIDDARKRGTLAPIYLLPGETKD